MARTQQVKEKGNAHTTEYEKDTPVETQGFYAFFPAYEMRRDTSSRLRSPNGNHRQSPKKRIKTVDFSKNTVYNVKSDSNCSRFAWSIEKVRFFSG